MYLSSTSPQSGSNVCYCFPYVGADLCKLAHQPGIQRTLRDHAICLFTSPAFAGYSFQPNHSGQAEAE